jgi:hypothetical protein
MDKTEKPKTTSYICATCQHICATCKYYAGRRCALWGCAASAFNKACLKWEMIPREQNAIKKPDEGYHQKDSRTPAEIKIGAKEGDEIGTMKWAIKKTCDKIRSILINKNEAYGNSAEDPVRIFSKADTMEQLNVRIDDKLSRLVRGHQYKDEDTEMDLIGYLILKQAIRFKRNTAFLVDADVKD